MPPLEQQRATQIKKELGGEATPLSSEDLKKLYLLLELSPRERAAIIDQKTSEDPLKEIAAKLKFNEDPPGPEAVKNSRLVQEAMVRLRLTDAADLDPRRQLLRQAADKAVAAKTAGPAKNGAPVKEKTEALDGANKTSDEKTRLQKQSAEYFQAFRINGAILENEKQADQKVPPGNEVRFGYRAVPKK